MSYVEMDGYDRADSSTKIADPFLQSAKPKRERQVPYYVVFWAVFGLLTLWCILDRFFGQLVHGCCRWRLLVVLLRRLWLSLSSLTRGL